MCGVLKIKNISSIETVTRILFSSRRKIIKNNFLKLFNGNKSIANKLNLISNSNLRSKLVNFYEVYYSIYKELEEEHKFFINKRVNDYFFNQFPSDTSNFVDPKFVISKLNDKTFKTILDNQITSLQYITENFFIEKIDELIKKITEELKNQQ